MVKEILQPTFFVPMTGTAEDNRKVKPDDTLTPLVNGGFEKAIGENKIPDGWYYIRQGVVESASDAKQGTNVLTFENTTPGRHAHGMQAFGVNGDEVAAIDLKLWVRGQGLASSGSNQQLPRVFIEFYDALRVPVGTGQLGPWDGSFDWKEQTARIRVPLRARLAVMGIGLFGGTGKMSFDDVSISIGKAR
jgi:protein-L-isoaspartate(D-aspartate) O-methyltransferase